MADKEPNYVLYHHVTSICSIMVRYCYALRGPSSDPPSDPVRIREESVDILHEGQMTEHYLCDINPFGEVPTLAPLSGAKTIPDSLRITMFLSQYYPRMIPASRHDEVSSLLAQLHAINYYSLTFSGKPETVEGIDKAVERRLEGNISDRYREALKVKLAHMEEVRNHAIEPAPVEQNRQRAMQLMQKLEPHVRDSKSGWLFGSDEPCALDAHLVVFIKRMVDVDRGELIPEKLQRYAQRAMEGKEWQAIQGVGSTKPTALSS